MKLIPRTKQYQFEESVFSFAGPSAQNEAFKKLLETKNSLILTLIAARLLADYNTCSTVANFCYFTCQDVDELE